MVNTNQVRIIGGKWRGRKIQLPDVAQVRPSADRIRETVFNWLAPVIHGAKVLDVFAGSGVLGFEALSRGAESAVLLDHNSAVVAQLLATQQLLQAEHATIMKHQFPQLLSKEITPFDIVFLDPPFHQQLLAQAFTWLHENHYLAEHALIYVETERELSSLPLLDGWEVLKEKQAGQVAYRLIQV